MRTVAAIVLAFLLGVAAPAAPAPTAVRVEIEALLGRLQLSGCQFNRNGSWYSASEAKSHLLRKLRVIENKTALRSAEQFIELAATASSSSGRAYQVRCGGGAAIPSAQWLANELAAVRGAVRETR